MLIDVWLLRTIMLMLRNTIVEIIKLKIKTLRTVPKSKLSEQFQNQTQNSSKIKTLRTVPKPKLSEQFQNQTSQNSSKTQTLRTVPKPKLSEQF